MKPMIMKIASSTLLAAIFLFTLAVAPLRAQTNAAYATATAAVNASPTTAVSTAVPANSNPAPAPQDLSAVTKSNYQTRWEEGNPHHNNSTSNGNGFWNIFGNVAVIVPLAGMFIGFAIPVTIIAICAFARHRRHKIANETLRAMIDKGMTITPELVASLKAKSPEDVATTGTGASPGNQSRKDLRNGLLLTGIGIGIVMLCGKPGWIVVFIGVAFLLIGMLNLGKGDKC